MTKTMGTRGKKYRQVKEKYDSTTRYPLDEALELLPQLKYAGFDESVDVAVRLGVDPKRADQMVRGTVALPHGTGKTLRILAFAKGEKEKEAEAAGADYVGGEDLVKKIADEGYNEGKDPSFIITKLEKEAKDLQIPIGWSTKKGTPRSVPSTPRGWILKIGGLLATTLLVSLGAPFWFDVLNRLANLRGSGEVPKKAAEEKRSEG